MVKATRDPVVLGTPLGIPEQRSETTAERDELVAEIAAHPAFRQIAEYLEHAKALGLDPSDLDVLKRAMAAGETAWRRDAAADAARQTWGSATSDLTSAGVGRHAPVVYYVRLGELVKIGTTTRIIKRCDSLGVQGVLAVEPGDSVREHERHRQFDHLRSHGEWFHLTPELAEQIAEVRADAESALGMTVEAWITKQRSRGSDFRARRLLKVNRPLYSDAARSVSADGPLPTLVNAGDAARFRGISRQLLNGWREQGKIQPAGMTTDGRPLYRLADIIRLDEQQGASPKSNRHR